jgi:hypothetical protein
MFSLERIKRYIWYVGRVRYLKNYEKYARMNLEYFDSVRSNNPLRQQIGLMDLNVSRLPRVNPKKEKMVMGHSTYVMEKFLEEAPKEYEKLQRWRRFKKVSNTYPIIGKVIFT